MKLRGSSAVGHGATAAAAAAVECVRATVAAGASVHTPTTSTRRTHGRGMPRSLPVRAVAAAAAAAVLTAAPRRAAAWQLWANDSDAGPGARDGHSMVVVGDALLVFGGRGNEREVPHIPRTFEVEKVNGSLRFVTYDTKPVYDCVNATEAACYNIQVGTYYNDMWAYPLNCSRGWDTGCAAPAWRRVEGGAALGGCHVVHEVEVCTHPHERYGHAAAAFDDGALLLYGGYARMCEDYCSDLWYVNASACVAGGPGCSWTLIDDVPPPASSDAPGKRHRAATAAHAASGLWALYGGFRLWHGMAQANSLANRWRVYGDGAGQLPGGGYLDDLWLLRYPLGGGAAALRASGGGGWRQVVPRESCYAAPPAAPHAARYDVTCTTHWPDGRAGAALAVADGDTLFLHGGYTVEFPYPQVAGHGAGPGTSPLAAEGLAPYPALPTQLDDLWRYAVAAGVWQRLTPAAAAAPRARFGHTLLLMGGVLLLHGGAADGNLLGDTWMYNIESGWWVQKVTHVHPLYPATCTSDVTPRGVVTNHSVWGEPTRGTVTDGRDGRAPAAVFVRQPRRAAPGWDGCRDRADGRTDLPPALQWLQPTQRAWHAAVVSARHGGVWLYGGEATTRDEAFRTDATPPTRTVGDLWHYNASHCVGNCSGHGACVVGHCVCAEGWYGLDCSNATCPGSYCVYDAHNFQSTCVHCASLPYVHRVAALLRDPAVNRAAAHRLVFGAELAPGAPYDWAALPADDYVTFARKGLVNFSALAASDARTRYLFDAYAGGVELSPAAGAAAAPRVTHGVCDGFGQCQCAPPFLSDDCSVLDCPSNCHGRGVCSVEYPVSRCLCQPPWTGGDCSILQCPNNCSWPLGTCVAGSCVCATAANPYNNTQRFLPYGGADCSFVMPFATAPPAPRVARAAAVAALLAVIGAALAHA